MELSENTVLDKENNINVANNVLTEVTNSIEINGSKSMSLNLETCMNTTNNVLVEHSAPVECYKKHSESDCNINLQQINNADDNMSKEINNDSFNQKHSQVNNESSDSEDDFTYKKTKTKNLLDSDSDSNDDVAYKTSSKSESSNSDSENEDNQNCNNLKSKVYKKFVNDDSDEEESVDNNSVKETAIYTVNNKGELIQEGSSTNSHMSRIADWCSPESDDENEEYSTNTKNSDGHDSDNASEDYTTQINRKSFQKVKTKHDEEPKKMTGKEAAEQRKIIHSEHQRMVRESRIYLPYHKPKTRTLKEFLQNRPRLTSAIPINCNAPPSLAIKMASEQLKIITQKLEEREKELEKFYKSETESEDDLETADKNDNIESSSSSEVITNENNADNTTKNNFENVKNPTQADDVEKFSNDPSVEGLCQKNVDNVEKMNTIEVEKENITNNFMSDQESCFPKVNVILDNISSETSKAYSFEQLNKTNAENETSCDSHFQSKTLINTIANNNNNNNDDDDAKEKSQIIANINNYKSSEEIVEKITSNVTQINDDRNKTAEVTENVVLQCDKKLNKLELLKNELAIHPTPKLSSGPDDVIELDGDEDVKTSGISKLMERFLKHTYQKSNVKNKVELSVVSVTGDGIHKETVSMAVEKEEAVAVNEKPGAKLQKLRDVLQVQMAQKRTEQWQQKKIECNDTDLTDAEKSECGEEDDDILDDEEEEETELTETSEEDEEESYYKEKPRNKSAFIDEEAEVSETENVSDENNEDIMENEGDVDSNSDSENVIEKKQLRRIIKAFVEDSDDEDINTQFTSNKITTKDSSNLTEKNESTVHSISSAKHQNISNNITKVDNNLDSTISIEDDDNFSLPPNRTCTNVVTPKHDRVDKKSQMDFISPLSNLTGLQNLNSGLKFLHESPISPLFSQNDPSPLKGTIWKNASRKALFEEDKSQPLVDDLVALCSGNFSEIEDDQEQDKSPSQDYYQTNQSDDCVSPKDVQNKTQQKLELVKLNSETVDENLDSVNDDDNLISQLLDEEEMEKFKKKFDSDSETQEKIVEETKTGGFVLDSDDEEQLLTIKKKKKQKLAFSDDEDSDEEVTDEDEEIDLQDEDDNTEVVVDYDSEENEIVLDEQKEITKNKVKVSDFVENEAELSESEWGSADEDEKDLDELEFELGDEDNIDSDKEKANLERIHMRQLLDEDNRDIKILQEMYLEDGELHGAGRQRQFRWRNIDNMENDNENGNNEEQEGYLDEEDANEEKWRRMRHERELFIKKQQENSQHTDDDIEDLANDSQILRLGQAAIRKNHSNSQPNVSNEKTDVSPPTTVMKESILFQNKRGSFLSRNDQVLTRLAEYTKVTTTPIVGAPKHTKNFVFQTVETETTTSILTKRKAGNDGTPVALKKLRLSNLSPAINKKTISDPSRAKKLF